MKLWYLLGFVLTYVNFSHAYSKYGRTCKDIGCLSSEVCVMETDPCSYYQRQNECGSYPTCKKMENAGPPSCKNYVCPPTKVCQMDGATPKCVDDHSKVGRVGYDTTELKSGAESSNSGNLYPNLGRGETTERPNIGYQPAAGPGYQGGRIGSGYPGNQRPQQTYPQQPYPQQPSNQNGYNYPYYNQNGYPNYNYNQNQRYPNYNPNGYNPYAQNPKPSSASGGIVDSLTNALKKYGTNLLKTAIANQLAGGGGNNRN